MLGSGLKLKRVGPSSSEEDEDSSVYISDWVVGPPSVRRLVLAHSAYCCLKKGVP